MDQELPDDLDDVEIAQIKLRIGGSEGIALAVLAEFQDYINATEHLEGERAGDVVDADEWRYVSYELFTDRTGVIAPAIEHLCALLKAAPEIEAGIKVPGYSKTFYGYEKDFVVRGRIAGSC